jgi:hypothetical protein
VHECALQHQIEHALSTLPSIDDGDDHNDDDDDDDDDE